jgi:signal transduction histidine kinase
MRWGIRYQLLVPLAALLLITTAVSAWTAAAASQRARRQVAARVAGVVHTLSEAQFPLTRAVLEQMKGLSGADYAVLGGSRPTATLAEPPADLPAADLHPPDELELGTRAFLGGRAYLCRGLRLRPTHPNAGGTLYVLYPEEALQGELRAAAWPLLALGIGGGLVAVALAVGVGQRLVGRIRELQRQTRRIADGDFRPMPLGGRDDELRDLSRSVNEMAQRLRQFQETVQKSERLRLLGQVSGGLAHQLRNAIAGAKLAVQLHARSCAGGDTEALDVARRQLARVEADLARFLDLDRGGGSEGRPCRVVELVEEATDLLRSQCRHAGVHLRWEPPACDPVVVGDAGRLGHVVINLLANAAEAAGPGGWCEITVRQPAAEVCIVEVRDNGPGPDPDVAGRLFEPFVTGKADGVGLGLFVARQAVEAHGGQLDWRREDGVTCFRVELPAQSGSRARDDGTLAGSGQGRRDGA